MARTFSGRQKHSGQSMLSAWMQDSAEIAGIKDYQAKQAAKAQADLAVAADVPAEEHWQESECSCRDLPDGRSYTCPACLKRQRDEDLVDHFEVHL